MEVTRELVLPVPCEEVWRALTDPERLAEWFANDVELDLDRGDGVFRWESGEVRQARVEEAELERRLALRWWDPETPGSEESEVVDVDPELHFLVVPHHHLGRRRGCGGGVRVLVVITLAVETDRGVENDVEVVPLVPDFLDLSIDVVGAGDRLVDRRPELAK